MRFVWDEDKNRRNLIKHKISFERATLVFDDPRALTVPDPYDMEERWRTMGLVNGVVIVLVVHTVMEEDDDETIRIISARKAKRSEIGAYECSRELSY